MYVTLGRSYGDPRPESVALMMRITGGDGVAVALGIDHDEGPIEVDIDRSALEHPVGSR